MRYADNNLSPQRPSPSLSLSTFLSFSPSGFLSLFLCQYSSLLTHHQPFLLFHAHSDLHLFFFSWLFIYFFVLCLDASHLSFKRGSEKSAPCSLPPLPLPRSPFPFTKILLKKSPSLPSFLSLPSLLLSHSLVLCSVTLVYLTLLACESEASQHL